MLKSEDVVIRMQINFKNINFLTRTDIKDYGDLLKIPPLAPFSDEVVIYLNLLSKEIKKDPQTKQFPDVATFSFFCRKANIFLLKKEFFQNTSYRLGRGTVFHIAPSNVPVNFAFSLVVGLLSGNTNIVRVPSKNFDQVNIIVNAINNLSEKPEHKAISERIILVKYSRSDSANEHFSSNCDVRVIWGGDETINQIRQNQIPPRAFDITFADRYSICAINADKFIDDRNPKKIALGFYNDTYLFDQNACTSPHLIIWLGSKSNIQSSQNIFWDNLYKIVEGKYTVQPVFAVDKITSFCNQSIDLNSIERVDKKDNLLWRVKLKKLPNNIDKYRCNSGYFFEYSAKSLSELSKIINRKYQTLAYYGFSKRDFSNLIDEIRPLGIDRIVPIGRTMAFSLSWDGYNLINTLSREIEII
jgi:hypothetical protein